MSHETIRIDLMRSVQEFLTAAERNLIKSAGLDDHDIATTSMRETYNKNCAAIWENLLRGLFGAEIIALQQALRAVKSSPRDELSELATRQADYRNAAPRVRQQGDRSDHPAALSPGETFVQFWWDRIITSQGRSLSRAELRAKARPAGFEQKKWDAICTDRKTVRGARVSASKKER